MLTSETRLGPYRIIAPIGAGGMGEVYRATDTRLGRDVAIKVLPPAFGKDPDRLRRFEQEARATGILNHPNILSIFDVGQHEGAPFVVAELLEGETLRDRLGGGKLAVRKATDYAQQIAEGLAAAHDKGIVHRDLKPENIFITRDGRAKILDFGLARVTTSVASGDESPDAPTAPIGTDPGVVLGTVGYMSPEQVLGKPADVRSDVFAFGTVLYEMLSGRRAFRRESAVETLNAILKEDPPELSTIGEGVPPALERIVNHCLEKQPESRFQSARDISFSLGTLSELSSTRTGVIAGGRRPVKWVIPALVAGALLLVAGGALLARRLSKNESPRFTRLTFAREDLYGAYFSPLDGSIVYGTYTPGGTSDLRAVNPPSTDFRSIGFPGHVAFGISRKGEVALHLSPQFIRAFTFSGTLAVAPLAGGTPREIAENVLWAAWSPVKDDLLVVRLTQAGTDQIEYPIGKPIYRSPGWVDCAAFSRDGSRIAFLDHPQIGSDSGAVAVIDLDGKSRVLTKNFSTIRGLGWSPDSKEIWFTAAERGALRALWAVDLDGDLRLLARAPSSLVLADVAADGRALLLQVDERMGIILREPGAEREHDYSWQDWTLIRDISRDGSQILFDETGEAGSDSGITYLRATDGSPAVRLSEGNGASLSFDGRWAVVRQREDARLMLVPTRAGHPRPLPGKDYAGGALHPDGKRIVVGTTDETNGLRMFVMNLDGSGRRAISPPRMAPVRPLLSPDGKWMAAVTGDDRRLMLLSVEGGPARVLASALPDDVPAGWSSDGRLLYVTSRTVAPPIQVGAIDIASDRRQAALVIPGTAMPQTALATSLIVAGDGRSYAFTYRDATATLFLAEGLR